MGACGLVEMDPRVYRYRSRRPDDEELRRRLRELGAERRRFGYRRLHLLLVECEQVPEVRIRRNV